MKRFLSVFLGLVLSLILFAGGGLSVITTSTSSAANRLVKKPNVKVILTTDKYFYAERFLGEKGNYYLFMKNGKKVMLPKAMVKEIKLQISVKEKEKGQIREIKSKGKKKEKEEKGKKKLILTDYNVEKNIYLKEDTEAKKENEAKKSSGLSVKVENQVIERKKDTITFKADIKNVTGLEVGKLSIILNIYDSSGKLVQKKKIFLAKSLKDGKSVPFTYSMKDPEGKITRFDYSFEGIVFKPVEKEE